MSSGGFGGWTDARLSETVTASYINSHLRSNEQELLKRPLYYGGDLTDDTYLDWILTKARLFFLVLVATGVPDQIFGLVDDAYDDDDLPVAEDRVADLRLSNKPDQNLDRRFYKTQFKFLTRQVGDGEHIRYADEETVPVVHVGRQSLISVHKEGIEHVKLSADSSTVFVRKSVRLDKKTSEMDILMEIAEMKKFSHDHVLSIYGSYLYQGVVNILSCPAADYTLKLFLSDVPRAFEALPKNERHRILINWPHCLATAVNWLHANGGHHGAIRPSNVYVSRDFNISLGHLDGPGIFCVSTKVDDIESYQYAAPERWKRAVTVQSSGSAKMLLPSGGRTAMKHQPEKQHPNDPSTRKGSSSSEMSRSQKAALEYAYVPTSTRSEYQRFRLSTAFRPGTQITPPPQRSRNANSKSIDLTNARNATFEAMDQSLPTRAPSALSLRGLSHNHNKSATSNSHGVFAALPETRSAVVQTWISVQHDSFAADIFSLGAVIFDILTLLCKKGHSAFARHRAAKNRNAGRGGGLADASFHANLGQVLLWAKSLSSEAEKKSKNVGSHVLRAVGPITQVALHCLEKNPELRPRSQVLEARLVEHMRTFADIDDLHCVASVPPPPRTSLSLPVRDRYPERLSEDYDLAKSSSAALGQSLKQSRESQANSDYLPYETSDRQELYDRFQERVFPNNKSAPVGSATSERSTTFDLDIQSDTTLNGDRRTATSNTHKFQILGRHDAQETYAYADSDDLDSNRPNGWRRRYSTESVVDPRLVRKSASSTTGDTGVFTYMHYSTTPSDEEEEKLLSSSHLEPGRQHTKQDDLLDSFPISSTQSSYYGSVTSTAGSPATSNTTIPASPHSMTKAQNQPPSLQPSSSRNGRGRPSPSEIAMLRQLARETMASGGGNASSRDSSNPSPMLLGTGNTIKPLSAQQLQEHGITVIDVDTGSSTATSSRMGAYETIEETDEDEHQIAERERQVEMHHRQLQQQQKIQVAHYLRQQQEIGRPKHADFDRQRMQVSQQQQQPKMIAVGGYGNGLKEVQNPPDVAYGKVESPGKALGMPKSRPVIGPSGGTKDRIYRTRQG